MNWRASNRLSLYLIQSACTFALAGLKPDMTSFESLLFYIGLILNLANTTRSFLDTSNPPQPTTPPNEETSRPPFNP